jgi:DNA (cytosine-5)-methyltransferase 1
MGLGVLHFYEFFAGGGMARAGLGHRWNCLLANDFSPMKADAYRKNWGGEELVVGDVGMLNADDLPGLADLAWASFPCQDLSLAGNYAGIGSEHDNLRTRSGTFWSFWKLMLDLKLSGRAPSIIVLENVYGILTSGGGSDFAAIGSCLALAGYRFGAALMDAAKFVPQSRPRVFIVAVRDDVSIPHILSAEEPQPAWHPPQLVKAVKRLDADAREAWIWWRIPPPDYPPPPLEALIEEDPLDVRWHSSVETKRLLSMMTELNYLKVKSMMSSGRRTVGTVYKRTREGAQRAELRCDGVAGCLRTPAGGSSRQLILVAERHVVRSRLISSREAARLMGLPDSYILPSVYNNAYHVVGDGVVVPVVRHLSATILEPLLMKGSPRATAAA